MKNSIRFGLLAFLLLAQTACQKAQFTDAQPSSGVGSLNHGGGGPKNNVVVVPATVTISFDGSSETPDVVVDSINFQENSNLLSDGPLAIATRQHLQYLNLNEGDESHSTSLDASLFPHSENPFAALDLNNLNWRTEYQTIYGQWFPASFEFSMVLNGGPLTAEDTTTTGFTIYRIHPIPVCHPSIAASVGEDCSSFTVTRQLCANTAAEDCPE